MSDAQRAFAALGVALLTATAAGWWWIHFPAWFHRNVVRRAMRWEARRHGFDLDALEEAERQIDRGEWVEAGEFFDDLRSRLPLNRTPAPGDRPCPKE